MSDDTAFMEKLEKLYEEYAPDMSHLPTADQIVSGLRFPDPGMTVDEQVALLNEVIKLIDETWNRYGKKENPLTNNQANNFFRFLLSLEDEYAIFGATTLIHKKIKWIPPLSSYWEIFIEKYQLFILDFPGVFRIRE